jgi:RNA polymerase sigma factor (sigma-70 family)
VKRVEEPLLKNLQAFIAFARSRVGDPHLAEDLVQESLLKALEAERQPETEENTIAWFYRILRRSIIDLYRRQDARARAFEKFERSLPDDPGADDERLLCECFKRLLPALPENYRELLLEVDLNGKPPAEVAAALGLTRNNLSVRLFRARKLLRDELSKVCRTCSRHGCLDCTCDAR